MSDVELDDLFSELKVLQVTLPDQLMSASEILHFVKIADCYPNASIAISDSVNYSSDSSIS